MQKDKCQKNNKQKATPGNAAPIADRWLWIAIALVLFTVVAIYFKALSFDFLHTWDDNYYISGNSHIKNMGWINIKRFFTEFYVGNYHPLTMLMYAAEYKVAGDSALLFRLSNILLHMANTVLVFVVIRKIYTGNVLVALITAAFFGVHPMHVESVAWISERKDVLYAFFFLLSLIMYTNYLQTKRLNQIISALVFFLFSCLSKPAAVIIPLVMLLFDYYTNRKYEKKLLLEKIPFFVISILFGVIALFSQQDAVREIPSDIPFMQHIAIISFSFVSYLYKALLPVKLSAVYPYPTEGGSAPLIIYYISILLVLLILWGVWYSRKWGKDTVFGFLFFVITIILVLQFIPIGTASMAERYTYIPYIGLFFVAGRFFEFLQKNMTGKFSGYKIYLSLIFILGFIIFSIISGQRVKTWKNDDILFSDVIAKYPGCKLAYLNRGSYYYQVYASITDGSYNPEKDKYLKMALQDFDKAIAIDNNYCKAYSNRGLARYNLNDYKGAIQDLDKAIEINPDIAVQYYYRGNARKALHNYAGAIKDYDLAIKLDTLFIDAYNNRGSAKNITGDYRGAIGDFSMLIRLSPGNSIAYFNRGLNENAISDYKNAIKDFNKAIEIDTGFAMSYYHRGKAKYLSEDYEGAIWDFGAVIRRNPQDAVPYNQRGNARYQLKDYRGALEEYSKAIERHPQYTEAIYNRDMVLRILKNQ
ncbi:MAG TPA: tetratricopeptide repeat protein [Bacteroidales bacterium]|nr:tetratricopeptide repeat protein [Bacteroidales bacterium]